MNKYLTIALLLTTLSLIAQDTERKKNQIRVGITGTHIIGETNEVTFYKFWTPRWPFAPNLEYRRRIFKRHLIGAETGFYQYTPFEGYRGRFADNTVLVRYYRTVNLNYFFSFLSLDKFEFCLSANGGYRFDAYEYFHSHYKPYPPYEAKSFVSNIDAFSLGLSTDLMFRLKWGLFLHGKAGFHRYFSEYAPNELRVVLGAGWEF